MFLQRWLPPRLPVPQPLVVLSFYSPPRPSSPSNTSPHQPTCLLECLLHSSTPSLHTSVFCPVLLLLWPWWWRRYVNPNHRFLKDLWVSSQELWPLDHRGGPVIFKTLIKVVECICHLKFTQDSSVASCHLRYDLAVKGRVRKAVTLQNLGLPVLQRQILYNKQTKQWDFTHNNKSYPSNRPWRPIGL
jgi:hypothetical protein